MKKLHLLFPLLCVLIGLASTSCSKKDKEMLVGVSTWKKVTDLSGYYHLAMNITKGESNIEKVVVMINNTVLTDYYGYKWDGQKASGSKGYYGSVEAVNDTTVIKFTAAGTYTVVVTAYDTNGDSESQTSTITLRNSMDGTMLLYAKPLLEYTPPGCMPLGKIIAKV